VSELSEKFRNCQVKGGDFDLVKGCGRNGVRDGGIRSGIDEAENGATEARGHGGPRGHRTMPFLTHGGPTFRKKSLNARMAESAIGRAKPAPLSHTRAT
jgi:hypothetical protein